MGGVQQHRPEEGREGPASAAEELAALLSVWGQAAPLGRPTALAQPCVSSTDA